MQIGTSDPTYGDVLGGSVGAAAAAAATDAVTDHEQDTSGAHPASAVTITDGETVYGPLPFLTSVSSGGGYYTSTTVQGALQELGPEVGHIADTSDAHDASAISIADAGGYFTGTDVEAALQELGAGSAIALDDLSDVVISSPTNKQVLAHDGTDWNNRTFISEAVVYNNGGTLEHVTNGAGTDWLFVNLMS